MHNVTRPIPIPWQMKGRPNRVRRWIQMLRMSAKDGYVALKTDGDGVVERHTKDLLYSRILAEEDDEAPLQRK